jgi:putative peptidoglycan lipid II flippase
VTSESISSVESMGVIGARAAGLAVAAAFGQAFVVAREVYVAAQVGTSADLDALLVALIAPMILVGLLSNGTQAALVPALLELNATAGPVAARSMSGLIIVGVSLLGVLAATVIMLLAGPVIAVGGPGLSDASRVVSQSFLPALLPLIVLAPVGTLLAAVCQASGMFREISVSWVAGPVAAMIVTIAIWNQAGVGALALATTADAAATAGVLMAILAVRGRLPWPGREVPPGAIDRFLRHAGPLTAGTSILSLNLLTDRAVASLLSTGAVSALRYGERVIRTPLSVLFPAWSTTVFPAIAQAVSASEQGRMGRTASDALRFVIAVFLPLTLATLALAPVVVAFAFERGAFGQSATADTAGVVAGFAPLILLWLVQPILTAAHNARRRGGLLARIAVLNAVANVVLNVVFGVAFGVAGVALSTSVTGWILVGILAVRLRELEPGFDLGAVLRVGARSLLAGLVPTVPIGVVAWLVRPELDLPGQFLFLAGATVIAGTVYLAMARLLRLTEPWIAVVALATIGRRRLGLAE